MLKTGAFAADAESRARFSAGFWDKPTADIVFGTGSVGSDKIVVVGNIDLTNHKFTNALNPTGAQDLVTLAYYNANLPSLATVLHADGSVVATGNLDMGSHRIVNVTNPTAPQDAATKAYVDSRSVVVVPYVANTALTATNGGQVATNTGAGGDIQLTLPPLVVGMVLEFAVTAGFYVKILNFDGSTTINVGTTASAAGGFTRSNLVGSMLRIVAVSATKWFAEVVTGTWTVDI